VSILTDLHRQRQTITHSRDTLHGADDNIARARKVRSRDCLRCASASRQCAWLHARGALTASTGVCLLLNDLLEALRLDRESMSARCLLSRPEQEHRLEQASRGCGSQMMCGKASRSRRLRALRQVLASMSRRITTNKLIMGAIILFLLLAIGIVVYSKFRK
jgi:hypothetical protein